LHVDTLTADTYNKQPGVKQVTKASD